MSASSTPPKSSADKQTTESEESNPKEPSSGEITFGIGVLLIFTAGLIVGHPGPVGATLNQWSAAIQAAAAVAIFFLGMSQLGTMKAQNRAAKAQLDQAEWESHQALRPYVGAVIERIDPTTLKDIMFESRFSNYGQTPAVNVRFTMTSRVLPFPLPDDFTFVDCNDPDPQGGAVVHPTQSTGGTSNRVANPISATDLAAWRSGADDQKRDVRLYCFGIVTYEDAFKKQHWTTYCMYYGPESIEAAMKAKPGESVQIKASLCHLHNEIGTYPKQKPKNR